MTWWVGSRHEGSVPGPGRRHRSRRGGPLLRGVRARRTDPAADPVGADHALEDLEGADPFPRQAPPGDQSGWKGQRPLRASGRGRGTSAGGQRRGRRGGARCGRGRPGRSGGPLPRQLVGGRGRRRPSRPGARAGRRRSRIARDCAGCAGEAVDRQCRARSAALRLKRESGLRRGRAARKRAKDEGEELEVPVEAEDAGPVGSGGFLETPISAGRGESR